MRAPPQILSPRRNAVIRTPRKRAPLLRILLLSLVSGLSSACLDVPESASIGAREEPEESSFEGARTDSPASGSAQAFAGSIELAGTTWLSTTSIVVRFIEVSREGNPFIAIYPEGSARVIAAAEVPFTAGDLSASGTHAFDPLPVGSYLVRLVVDSGQVLQELQLRVSADSDDDGTADELDLCARDPEKTSPGACGCGVSDADGDRDLVSDCMDLCPADVFKVEPGACGCNVAETDEDGDGKADCVDGCPRDALKNAAGACGCGFAETDSDQDGTPDCNDRCAQDPNKVTAGSCGCGVLEGTCAPSACSNELAPEINLGSGDQRCSQNSQFTFGLNASGFLTLREGSEVIWSALQSRAAATLRLQGDGNLVARDAAGAAVWSSSTAGKTGAVLRVENDGAVVLRQLGVVVWSIGPFRSGDTLCREARENQTVNLACPAGRAIAAIEFASYGKPTGVCGSYAIDSSCNFTAESIVATQCVGKTSCEFLVDQATFTTPCSGTKRLLVEYTCDDQCPSDPSKFAPGQCGCGVADTDSDSDGTADCQDLCPANASKVSEGQCGCALADTDSDSDGTADCKDLCAASPAKIEPGQCGCDVADTDSDKDGTVDCKDLCPSDANKTAAGQCGCGVAEGTCPTQCSNQLLTDAKLLPGEHRCSQNGQFTFGLNQGGNLTLQEGSTVLWSAFQSGVAASAKLQGDGNLVARNSASAAVWASNTSGKTGAVLTVDNNGSVVLRQLDVVVWSIGPFQSGSTLCREARENQMAQMACPSGQSISVVEFASYGKPTGVCGSYAIDTACHYSAQSYVQTQCIGKNTCEFLVDKATFTVPCTGTKRLVVAYQCAIP